MASDTKSRDSWLAAMKGFLATPTFRFFAVAFVSYALWIVAYE